MGLELIHGKMEEPTLDHGWKGKCMEKGYISGQMGEFIKGTIKMIIEKVMEPSRRQMGVFMTDSGKVVSNMELESSHMQVVSKS